MNSQESHTIRMGMPEPVLGSVPEGNKIESLNVSSIMKEIEKSPVIIFDGVASPSNEQMIAFAEQFRSHGCEGVLDWNGQKIFELKPDDSKGNYIFSNEKVPLHWDGAFKISPSLLMFYCDEACGQGGETVFVDTTAVAAEVESHYPKFLESLEITICSEKKVHYGGEKTLSVLAEHPHFKLPIMRAAESVTTELNPVQVTYRSGCFPELSSETIEEMLVEFFHSSSFKYEHNWKKGQLVIVDNHRLLHGRNAFDGSQKRRMRRLQVK